MNGVRRFHNMTYSKSADFGYVIIPEKVDRDKYVATCFRRERVTILSSSGGGMIKDCYISKSALREIDFPKTTKETGTAVAYITNSFLNKPIIVGALSKESDSQLLEEGEFRQEKEFNGNKVSITGKAKTGDIFIDIDALNGTGNLFINVSGKDGGNSIKINCKGKTSIFSDESIDLDSTGEVNLKTTNPDSKEETYLHVENGEVRIEPSEDGKFIVSSGSESILLGDETVKQLLKELTIAKSITGIIKGASIPEPGNGAVSAFQAALKAALGSSEHADYSSVKSKISFTD